MIQLSNLLHAADKQRAFGKGIEERCSGHFYIRNTVAGG